MMVGPPVLCNAGIRWGRASSPSMMARPVWGTLWGASEGKMGWPQIAGSHIWIGSSSTLESFSGVGGGGHGCWGIRLLRRIWRCHSMACGLSGVASWMPSMAAVRRWVALRMQSVAVTTGILMAWFCTGTCPWYACHWCCAWWSWCTNNGEEKGWCTTRLMRETPMMNTGWAYDVPVPWCLTELSVLHQTSRTLWVPQTPIEQEFDGMAIARWGWSLFGWWDDTNLQLGRSLEAQQCRRGSDSSTYEFPVPPNWCGGCLVGCTRGICSLQEWMFWCCEISCCPSCEV